MIGVHCPASEKISAERKVWLLAGLAFVTIATILTLFTIASRRMEKANKQLAETEDRLQEFTTLLNLALTDAQREQLEVLNEQPFKNEWSGAVKEALSVAWKTAQTPSISNHIVALESAVESLKRLATESRDWSQSRHEVRTNLLATKTEAENQLQILSGMATNVAGLLHFRNATKIRRLKNLPPGPEGETLARDILSSRDYDAEVGHIQGELSTLALLCERIASETDISQLVDYKDNLITPSLLRLARACTSLGTFDPDFAARIEPLRRGFEKTLLGENYQFGSSYLSVVAGLDGLYGLCRRQLELRQRREVLRRASVQQLDDIRAEQWALQLAVDSKNRDRTSYAIHVLGRTWKGMLGLGMACMGVFIVLARRVARTLKGQIETIESNNRALSRSEEESRQIAESLRQSEQSAQNSLRELSSMKFALDEHAFVSITDTDGNILYANEKFCTLSQYSSQELLGQNHRILKSGFHTGEFFEGMYRALVAGKTWRGELCNRAKDGTLFWMDTTIVPFLDGTGKLIQYVALRTDITERKKVEAAQAESEMRFRQLAEHINDVFWIVTPDNQMIYISPTFEAIWGHSCRQLYDNPALWLDAIHPDDLNQVLHALETKQSVGTYDEEYRIVRPDGTIRWIRDRAFPIRSESGSVFRIVGVARDITQQRLILSQLSEARERFDLAVRGSYDGIWDWNPQTNETYCSPRFKELLGFADAEMLNLFDARGGKVHPEDRDRLHQALKAHINDRHPYDVEYRLQTRTGDYRWFRDKGQALWNDSGQAIRMAGSISDIHDRKCAEADLREAKEMAEALARKAQAASKAKSEFLATMSHEIRTPLNGVLGYASLLQETTLNEEQRDQVAIIRNSSDALMAILNDILDFSKIEAGKLVVERLAFDLTETIEGVASLLRLQATRKGLYIEVETAASLPYQALADPVRFRQVLLNLAGNALKFTDTGGIAITVVGDGTPDGPEASQVTIRVRDTGIGISNESQPLLFEKFTQADSSTTRRFGGTGLGLAISKRLVELMGGQIGMESAPGRGSTFWFTVPVIPRSKGAGSPGADPKEPDSQPAPTPLPAGDSLWQVLVAEDTFANQKLVEQFLKLLNCRVDLANNGREAVELARKKLYDVVFMDLHMPEMDGCEASMEIRRLELAGELPQSPSGQRLPIVALTASVVEEDRERCRLAGMDDFLTKPIYKAALRGSLIKFAARRRMNATSPDPSATPLRPHEMDAAGPVVGIVSTEPDQGAAYDEARSIAEMESSDLFLELVGVFLKQLPVLVCELDAAVEARDPGRIRHAAHALKGSVRLFHASPAVEASQNVETLGQEGRLETVEVAAEAMKRELEKLRRALEARLKLKAA